MTISTFFINSIVSACCLFFFLNIPAPPEISPLPQHAPLPIPDVIPSSRTTLNGEQPCAATSNPRIEPTGCRNARRARRGAPAGVCSRTSCRLSARASRSEEHTSELQSQSNLVCRLLLEKKKQH